MTYGHANVLDIVEVCGAFYNVRAGTRALKYRSRIAAACRV